MTLHETYFDDGESVEFNYVWYLENEAEPLGGEWAWTLDELWENHRSRFVYTDISNGSYFPVYQISAIK